ncbi:MAG: NADH-quinone oxidoreductase subunit J [Candidatus Spyradosoma sp.]
MVDILFYLFAALTLASALLVVVNRKPVNCVVAMILTIVGVAANFFLLDAPFLATLLIMVYAGAVIVLFLFVIMLMDPDVPALKRGWFGTALGGAAFFALCAAGTVWLFGFSGAVPALEAAADVPAEIAYSNEATAFGWPLFTKYVVLVEASALLLLAAMVSVFMLHRRRGNAGKCGCSCACGVEKK